MFSSTVSTPKPSSDAAGSNKKLRILIVEDHAPTRMAMSRLIRTGRCGCCRRPRR
jgi:hypothetical protein